MPYASTLPFPRPHRHDAFAVRDGRRGGVAGWVVAWALGATFSACAEVPPPRARAADDTSVTTVALYQSNSQRASAWRDAAATPRGASPTHQAPAVSTKQHHDASSIPTPIDNPWALCLLAAVVASMVWVDRRQKPDWR